jgi:hypothetical protein
MTETLAATVAAVVPVLMLMAAVEYQQIFRKSFPVDDEGTLRRLELVLRDVEAASGQDTPELVGRAREALSTTNGDTPRDHEVMLSRYMLGYVVLAWVMFMIEGVCLIWLAWPETSSRWDGPVAFGVVFGTLIGFAGVMLLPFHFILRLGKLISERRRRLMDVVRAAERSDSNA